jgi:hypothetical protein
MSLKNDIAAIPQIARGQVWCTKCGHTERANGARATLGGGWPKCCGYTMTIDSPAERDSRKALEEAE